MGLTGRSNKNTPTLQLTSCCYSSSFYSLLLCAGTQCDRTFSHTKATEHCTNIWADWHRKSDKRVANYRHVARKTAAPPRPAPPFPAPPRPPPPHPFPPLPSPLAYCQSDQALNTVCSIIYTDRYNLAVVIWSLVVCFVTSTIWTSRSYIYKTTLLSPTASSSSSFSLISSTSSSLSSWLSTTLSLV